MYFGARYYDPRTSVWQSADPIMALYLTGKPNGGVFNSFNLNFYAYTAQNPVKYIDPTGLTKEKAKVGDVLFFDWFDSGKNNDEQNGVVNHAVIVTKVGDDGIPTEAFGLWHAGEEMSNKKLTRRERRSIMGIGKMKGLKANGLKQTDGEKLIKALKAKWKGRLAAGDEDNNNYSDYATVVNDPVCLDVITDVVTKKELGIGGKKLRKVMGTHYKNNKKAYRRLIKKMFKEKGLYPTNKKSNMYFRKNPILRYFFRKSKRYIDLRKRVK